MGCYNEESATNQQSTIYLCKFLVCLGNSCTFMEFLAHTEAIPEDDIILSGWGDVDDSREDLLKDWGHMLEEWDGRDKDKPKPNKLIKLCRKVN